MSISIIYNILSNNQRAPSIVPKSRKQNKEFINKINKMLKILINENLKIEKRFLKCTEITPTISFSLKYISTFLQLLTSKKYFADKAL